MFGWTVTGGVTYREFTSEYKMVRPVPNNNKMTSISDQLGRAAARLQLAGQEISVLHCQWKSFLYGCSWMVIGLSSYHLQTRIKTCLRHLDHAQIQGYAMTIPRIITDSAALLAGLIVSLLLCWYLRMFANTVAPFSHPLFVSAQVSAIAAMVLFWIRMTAVVDSDGQSDDDDAKRSCVEPDAWTYDMRRSIYSLKDNKMAPFPVAVVFLVIVSLSLWFMNHQRQQHVINVTKVESLRNELKKTK
jgi:hypothetical protein